MSNLARTALMLALVVSGCAKDSTVSGPDPLDGDNSGVAAVAIPDSNLVQVIRESIGQPNGDLVAAALVPVTALDATSRAISDLTGIENLANLVSLDLSDNEVQDITPLSQLTQLQFLVLDLNDIADLSPLAGLQHLTSLSLVGNTVADISTLVAMPSLDHVELTGNPLGDEARTDHMPALAAAGVQVVLAVTPEPPTPLVVVTFADPLLEAVVRDSVGKHGEDLTNEDVVLVAELMVYAARMNSADPPVEQLDLEGFEQLEGLRVLSISLDDKTQVLNISRLTSLPGLRSLRSLQHLASLTLQRCDVQDLSSLSELPELSELGLWDVPVGDLSPLSALPLTRLTLKRTEVTDLSPLLSIPTLSYVDIARCPLSEESKDSHMAALRERGVEVLWWE